MGVVVVEGSQLGEAHAGIIVNGALTGGGLGGRGVEGAVEDKDMALGVKEGLETGD